MDKLTPLLEKLAEQLGVTVQYLWTVLVKQATIEIQRLQIWMPFELWSAVFCIVIMIFFLVMVVKEGDGGFGFLALIFFIAGFFLAVGYVSDYTALITLRGNPEYWALQEILSKLK